MVDDSQFATDQRIREWTPKVEKKLAVAVALRCGLRTLPALAYEPSESLQRYLLGVLRSALSGLVLHRKPSDLVAASTRTAILSIRDTLYDTEAADAASAAAALAINWGADTALHAFRDTGLYSDRANEAISYAQTALAHAARLHLIGLKGGHQIDVLDSAISEAGRLLRSEIVTDARIPPYSEPLWREGEILPELDNGLRRLRDFLELEPFYWDFWIRWYEAELFGRPLPLELLEQIANIPAAYWEAGPKKISEKINEIEARLTLVASMKSLEAEVLSSSSRHGLGGNFPPEPIDDVSLAQEELVILWQPLQDLKEQVEKDDPDPSKIGAALEALAKALTAGLKWCAEKADLVVDTTIKWGIPAIGGGYFAMNPDKIEAVIKAGEAWLKLLP